MKTFKTKVGGLRLSAVGSGGVVSNVDFVEKKLPPNIFVQLYVVSF